jgi:hypothetical protein
MKFLLFVGVMSAMTIGIYNIMYKNILKDYQTLDLSSKNWEEE